MLYFLYEHSSVISSSIIGLLLRIKFYYERSTFRLMFRLTGCDAWQVYLPQQVFRMGPFGGGVRFREAYAPMAVCDSLMYICEVVLSKIDVSSDILIIWVWWAGLYCRRQVLCRGSL